MSFDADEPVPPSSRNIEPGEIVVIHSLQSAGGQKLNGKDGLVIGQVKDDQGELRFQVKVRGSKPVNSTTAIKPTNLKVKDRLPLPQEGGRPRGYVEDVPEGENRCPILAEFLIMHNERYTPPKTKLTGFPAMAFSELGQYHFTCFTAMQMEWVAGCYALGDIIKKGGASAVEDVVFALLEGDVMYLDVFIITMTNTPFIGDEAQAKEKYLLFHEYKDARQQLTPDQDHEIYIKTLKIGPMRILYEASKLKLGGALFAALKKSPVYYLLVQRFLRWIAREGHGTADGKELGPMCREMLPKMCEGGVMPDAIREKFEKGPLDLDAATKLIDHVSEFDSLETIGGAFKTTLGSLSHGEQVSKYMSMLNMKRRK